MGSERFLIIRCSLHGSQSRFQITPNLPLMRSIARARPIVSRVISRDASDCSRTAANRPRPGRVGSASTGSRRSSVRRLGSSQNQPVQWCEALHWDLPAKRERGVLLGSIAELHRCEMLGNGSKTVLDVLPIQLKLFAPGIEASECDVDVGMFRVEVRRPRPNRAMCGDRMRFDSSRPASVAAGRDGRRTRVRVSASTAVDLRPPANPEVWKQYRRHSPPRRNRLSRAQVRHFPSRCTGHVRANVRQHDCPNR